MGTFSSVPRIPIVSFDTSALGQLTDPPTANNAAAQAAVGQVVRLIAAGRFRLLSTEVLVREASRVRADLRQVRLTVLDLA